MFLLSGKEKGSEREGWERGLPCKCCVQDKCASITHPTEKAYLPVYVNIHLHHLTCLLHINQNVKEVVTKNL